MITHVLPPSSLNCTRGRTPFRDNRSDSASHHYEQYPRPGAPFGLFRTSCRHVNCELGMPITNGSASIISHNIFGADDAWRRSRPRQFCTAATENCGQHRKTDRITCRLRPARSTLSVISGETRVARNLTRHVARPLRHEAKRASAAAGATMERVPLGRPFFGASTPGGNPAGKGAQSLQLR